MRIPSLREAVARTYASFAHHRVAPLGLGVCPCCVSEQVATELRDWALPRLEARHFYEYNTSAKPVTQSVSEIGHFLPRMLELVATGEDIHHSTELSLVRLGHCPADSWCEDERAALDSFALALFDSVLRGAALLDGAAPWGDDPLATLLMFDIGGVDVDPLLEHWRRCDDPFAAIRFVEATYWNFWPDENYDNSFAKDRAMFRRRLKAWVLESGCRRQFADRLVSPEFQCIAASRDSGVHVPFPLMVDAVFDHLTR